MHTIFLLLYMNELKTKRDSPLFATPTGTEGTESQYFTKPISVLYGMFKLLYQVNKPNKVIKLKWT